jgi:hypothetical protein
MYIFEPPRIDGGGKVSPPLGSAAVARDVCREIRGFNLMRALMKDALQEILEAERKGLLLIAA